MSIRRIDFDAPLEDILAIMEEDGAVILKNALSYADFLQLSQEAEPLFEKAAFCEGLFFGAKTKRLHGLVRKSEAVRKLVPLHRVVEVMNGVLSPYCDKIQLNLTQGIQIWPGERPQVIHRDDDMFPVRDKSFECMVNAMWALGEFTKENGATVVVPGSHKWPRDRQPAESELAYAEMQPGEVLLYLGSALHSGGANNTRLPRTGLVISYCLGWLRQSENQYLVAPPPVSRAYSPELQTLLGYTVHRPNLGMYEGVEPSVTFRDGADIIITRDWLTPEQNAYMAEYHATLDRRLSGT